MKPGTLVAALLVITCALSEVTCMTNKEFFELVKSYAEDIEAFDVDDPAIKDDDDKDSGVIDLPGGPDDELDLEYLIAKLDLANELQNLQVCVRVSYVRKDNGFYFSILVNGIRVFHHEIPVRNPPALCYPVPKLRFFVSACVGIYNVNVRAKSMCLEAYALINLWFKKFKFGVKIGCFRIPMLDEDLDILKLLKHVETSVEDTETGEVHEVALSNLQNLYRQLQIEAGEKNDHKAETGNDESDSLMFLPVEENDF